MCPRIRNPNINIRQVSSSLASRISAAHPPPLRHHHHRLTVRRTRTKGSVLPGSGRAADGIPARARAPHGPQTPPYARPRSITSKTRIGGRPAFPAAVGRIIAELSPFDTAGPGVVPSALRINLGGPRPRGRPPLPNAAAKGPHSAPARNYRAAKGLINASAPGAPGRNHPNDSRLTSPPPTATPSPPSRGT